MDFEEKWKELLEDDDYYNYNKYCNTIEDVRDALNSEWGDGGSHGYGIFDLIGTGILTIMRIDDLSWYDSDEEAARQAEKDGIKIIHDIKIDSASFLLDYDGCFIDTPENRNKILRKLSRCSK